jgi:hypothetical protein
MIDSQIYLDILNCYPCLDASRGSLSWIDICFYHPDTFGAAVGLVESQLTHLLAG